MCLPVSLGVGQNSSGFQFFVKTVYKIVLMLLLTYRLCNTFVVFRHPIAVPMWGWPGLSIEMYCQKTQNISPKIHQNILIVVSLPYFLG